MTRTMTRSRRLARWYGAVVLAIFPAWMMPASSAHAETLVAVRPGAMCAVADALARLTLPDGSDRAALPGHPEARAIAQAGGCIDIQPGTVVALQTARHNTSVVLFDAGDGRGARSFIVPNVDFAVARPGSDAPATPPVAVASGAADPALPTSSLQQPPGPSSAGSSPAGPWSAGPAPSFPAPPAPAELPLLLDYPSAVVALLKQSPGLMGEPSVAAYWASLRHSRDFDRVRNQEFALQPLLAQARAELAQAVAAAPAGIVQVLVPAQFGEYDFDRSRFPVALGFDQVTLQFPCCGDPGPLPRTVQLHVAGLDAIDGLPMALAAAQALVATRTSWGNVDRRMVLLLTIRLDPPGIAGPAGGQATASGTVRTLDMLSGERDPRLLYGLTEAGLDRLRAQKADRDAAVAQRAREREAAAQQAAMRQQAQDERAQLLAQRQNTLARLAAAPLSVRLASFILPGDDISNMPLDDLRDAREQALLSGRPVAVDMLVRVASRDGDRISTDWPGHLTVLLPPNSLPGHGAGWYLVSGTLRVPPGDDLPPALLRARFVHACARPRCADAAEPEAIVDRKLAAADPTFGSTPSP